MNNNHNQLASCVAALREQRKWSVTETARRAGLSTSMLWKVENGQASMTYEKLVALADAFGVEIGELFSGAAKRVHTGGRRVVNYGLDAPMVDVNGNAHYFLATDIADKHLLPCVIEVHANDPVSHDAKGHAGEEFAYVLEGIVDVDCEGYQVARLHVGDSIYFDACLRHRYMAVGDQPARVLCAFSNPQSMARMAPTKGIPSQPEALRLFSNKQLERPE